MHKGTALSIAIALIVLTSVASIDANALEFWWFVPSLENKLEFIATYRYNFSSLDSVANSALIIINGKPYLVVANQTTVAIVNLTSNTVVKTLRFNGGVSIGPVVAGNGTAYIFVYNSSSNIDTIYDINGNIVFSYSTNNMWLLEARYDWYRGLLYFYTMYNCSGNYCYKFLAVSTKTGNITLSIDTGIFMPQGMAFNRKYIYILLPLPNLSIWVVNASTGNVVRKVNVTLSLLSRGIGDLYANDYGVVALGAVATLFRSLDLSDTSNYLVLPAQYFYMILDARDYVYGAPNAATGAPVIYVIDNKDYAVGVIQGVYAISTDAKLLNNDCIAVYDPSTGTISIARPAPPTLFATVTATVTSTQTVTTTVTQYPSTPSAWILPTILVLITLAIVGIVKLSSKTIIAQKMMFVKKKQIK
jgi:hypothetical protein